MVILGYFLNAVAEILHVVIFFAMIVLIARAVLSWVSPDPSNMIVQFIYSATEPMLVKARSKIPPLGMLDMSVFVVILILYFIDAFLVKAIQHYAFICLRSGSVVVGG